MRRLVKTVKGALQTRHSLSEPGNKHPTLTKAVGYAWEGFKLLSTSIELFLDGTPFKTPFAVLNLIIETGEVSGAIVSRSLH